VGGAAAAQEKPRLVLFDGARFLGCPCCREHQKSATVFARRGDAIELVRGDLRQEIKVTAKTEVLERDKYVGCMYSGHPSPSLVAKSGLQQYEAALAAVLARGIYSLAGSLPASPLDAAGAENVRSGRTDGCASLLSMASDGGVCQTRQFSRGLLNRALFGRGLSMPQT
jgi:hypothetical protein